MVKRLILALCIVLLSTVAFSATKSYVIWTTFSSGELSPLIDGQVNFDKYFTGVKTLENFLVRPQGPVSNRPGFKFIAETKTSADQSRLVPFVFSDTQAYALEFGDEYMRFYRDGGQLTGLDAENVLNLSMNGLNGSVIFTDNSTTSHTMTAVGNAQITTATKKFSTGSGIFDGTGDAVTTPDHADFDLSAADGGIDVWVRPTVGNSGKYTIFRQDVNADSEIYMQAYLDKYTGVLLNGNGDDESTTISDSSLNTKTMTTDGTTSLLLHGSGEDETKAIFDSSKNEYTVDNDGAEIDTAQSVFGGSSIYFDGSDYLSIDDAADLRFDDNDWNISLRARLDGTAGDRCLFFKYKDALTYVVLQTNSSAQLYFNSDGTTILGSSLSINTWYHVEVNYVASSNKTYLFIDGVLQNSGGTDIGSSVASDPLLFGVSNLGGAPFHDYMSGWIDEVRYVRESIHTADFTIPTIEHAAVEIDASDPKFGTGAIKFGGYDYLTHAGDSDFDIGATGSAEVFSFETWIYIDEFQRGTLFEIYEDANNYVGVNIAGTQLEMYHRADGGAEVDGASAISKISVDNWIHILVVGNGSTMKAYINGSGAGAGLITLTDTLNDTSSSAIYIGESVVNSDETFSGLMDDWKFSLNAKTVTSIPSVENRNIAHPVFEIGDTVPTIDTVSYPDDVITADSFHHVEINYDVSEPQVYMFVDGQLHSGGVQAMTLTASGALDSVFSIGTDPDGSTLPYKGWMDELRFTNGTLRHTADFVPPVSEYSLLGVTPVEITTPYLKADLFQLQFAQSADILYIAHSGYAPKKLIRITDTSWALRDMKFLPEPFASQSEDPETTLSLAQKEVGAGITLTAGAAVFKSGDIGRMIIETPKSGDGRAKIKTFTDTSNVDVDISQEFSGTSLGSGDWIMSGNTQSATLTLPSATVEIGDVIIATSSQNVFRDVDIGSYISAEAIEGSVTISLLFKIVDRASETSVTLVSLKFGDVSGVVDQKAGILAAEKAKLSCSGSSLLTNLNCVLQATVIKDVTLTSVVLAAGDWDILQPMWDSTQGFPSSVTFFENRLLWAGSPRYPQTIWGSVVDDYENHLGGTNDSDAYQFTLAGRQVNKIRWLDASDVLLIGTNGAEWALGTRGSSAPTTPSNVNARVQTSYGSELVQAVNIGQSIIYLQQGGEKVREMIFNFDDDKHNSPDMSILAEHITEGGIVEMDYQDNPISTGWFVRSDGILLSMTLLREQNVIGWARHITDGSFESIAIIPGLNGDEIWAIVNRTIGGATKRYVELMNPIYDDDTLDSDDAFFVDSGLLYTGVSTATITGLDHLEGETVSVLGNGVVLGDETVSSGTITIDTASTRVAVGLPYTSTLQTMRIEQKDGEGTAQGRMKFINRVVFRVDKTKQFQYGQIPTGTLKTHTFDSLYSGDKELDFVMGNNREGYVSIVNSKPLPITVLAIIPELNLSN